MTLYSNKSCDLWLLNKLVKNNFLNTQWEVYLIILFLKFKMTRHCNKFQWVFRLLNNEIALNFSNAMIDTGRDFLKFCIHISNKIEFHSKMLKIQTKSNSLFPLCHVSNSSSNLTDLNERSVGTPRWNFTDMKYLKTLITQLCM